ncbi:transglycosylase family protein [Streptomyces sp. NPDC089919]|uniref:transglycosylase family protein n=1 Tax=Streptomyces sp. NPDC089919 TaxID=3155188 RepID=UPI0034420832
MTGVGIALPLLLSGTAEAASPAAWEALAQCESSGNWQINTGNGYHGGLQFSPSTWLAYGGGQYAPQAHLATKAQQIAVAEKVLASQGAGAWGGCAGKISGQPANPNATAGSAPARTAPPKSAPAKSAPAKSAPAKTTGSGAGTYTVKAGDTLSHIAEDHGLTWQELHAANQDRVQDPRLILPGQKLVIPGGAAAAKAPAATPAKAPAAKAAASRAKAPKAVHPVSGNVSAGYRTPGAWALGYHSGVDFAAQHGARVDAAAAGVVQSAGWNGAFGNQVVVKHRLVIDGKQQIRYSSYSHLSKITVSPGATVDAGTQLGTVGSTGRANGPHLHFEVGTTPDTYSSNTNPFPLLRGDFARA